MRDDAARPLRPPEATRELCLGGQTLAYRLRRSRRRSIGFVVDGDGDGLTVAAPRWAAVGDIDAALRHKAAWVLRKLAEQQERAARLRASHIDWRDGATLPFLGHTLRIALDGGVDGALFDTDGVGTTAPLLRLGLPPTAAAAQVRDAVRGWLHAQARRVFEERCAHYAPRLGVQPRRLALSSARTRWGSAGADGSVRLNWRLVHFALPTIDYVVAHELAHLLHMDHGPRFWAAVRSVVADVEQARGTLKHAVLPAFD